MRVDYYMKAVFLDRDGVINQESPSSIRTPDEWKPFPGSLEAIQQFTRAGLRVYVITNQAGIARGFYTEETLSAIHQKMLDEVAKLGGKIDKIFYCPHASDAGCDCRKPNPGMLYRAAEEFHLQLSKIHFVGDSMRDIEAGQQAGCIPVLVKTGNGKHTLKEYPKELEEVAVFDSLYQAAPFIIKNTKE